MDHSLEPITLLLLQNQQILAKLLSLHPVDKLLECGLCEQCLIVMTGMCFSCSFPHCQVSAANVSPCACHNHYAHPSMETYPTAIFTAAIVHCLVEITSGFMCLFSICERVTPRLSHANAAVVLSAVKVRLSTSSAPTPKQLCLLCRGAAVTQCCWSRHSVHVCCLVLQVLMKYMEVMAPGSGYVQNVIKKLAPPLGLLLQPHK